jgi:SAM-dependent methyltransferase
MSGQIDGSKYGDVYADVYDELFATRDDLNVVSTVLAQLAGSGPVLEMGIGTGRLALPLAQSGVKVHGIDNSQAMLDRLCAKPGAQDIVVHLGDASTYRIDKEFSLIFIAFSTLFLLENQESQVECFLNAARHLKRGGVFLVEAFVHDRSRWNGGQEVVTTSIRDDGLTLRAGMLDSYRQVIHMHQLDLSPQGIKVRPNRLRFIYPSEMDLMARVAGFYLRERWSDWQRSAFSAGSTTQIAVYEKVSESAI